MSMYAVFVVYHKHGDSDLLIFHSDNDMRKFCIETLDDDYNINIDSSLSLEMLISKTIYYGRETVHNQVGWGVINIVKGNNLFNFTQSI